MVELIQVEKEEHLTEIKQLFKEYVNTLGFNLHFQDYMKELTELPGDYSPPSGRLYLVLYNGNAAGCIALRKLEDTICEMKRMYVKLDFRHKGIGRMMAQKVIDEARHIGYERMRLDTIDSMREAIALYQSLGFSAIPPYRYNPIKGAFYMELIL